MIVTTRLLAFTCCRPGVDGCMRSDLEAAIAHASERAWKSEWRQRVLWKASYAAFMIFSTQQPIKVSTWTFDGRTYQIVDAQS